MTDELLMMTPAYAPFIHTGGRNSAQNRARHQPHPDTFGLWGSLDGRLTFVDGAGSKPLHLAGPAALFVTPGVDRVVSTTAGSRWYFLRFDVVAQPRRRMPGCHAWCHATQVIQPDPRAIWGYTPPTVVPDFLRTGTIQLLRDCCALWWRNDHFHAQANASLGHWVMDYVIHHRTDAGLPATGSGLHQRCRELIRERLGLGIDVADLAAACGYSRVHFARRFRSETGMRPGDFIREERMAHACHLLASTGLGLNQVAESCGYRSVAAFSRAFTGLHGSAPGTWRRQYR